MQHKSNLYNNVSLLVKVWSYATDLVCPDSIFFCSCDDREIIAGATRTKPAMSCSQSGVWRP